MRTHNPRMDGKRVLLGAHRGDRRHYPENTMAAFRAAVKIGCDAIETDVRMTKDGHLVLIHDRDVDRTTNGHGKVDDMTLDELRELDAGSWKSPVFTGEKIPTVEEFLDLIAPTGMLVNWELKEYPADFGMQRAFATVDKLATLIDRYDMAERSLMNSFSDLLLDYVDDKWPHKFAIHGYIHYNRPKDTPTRPLHDFLDWAAIWRKDADHTTGFREDYDFAAQRDILTCILVTDTAEEYRKALSMGCRMFTSDDPAEGMAVLKALGEK